jgi:hypothetical protein
MLTLFHVHLPPAKADALGFQAQPLLDGRIAAQLDFSARSQDALPGQSEAAMQHLCHLPRRPRKSRSSRNRPVSGHRTLGNPPDGRLDLQSHLRGPIWKGPIRRRLRSTLPQLLASLLHSANHHCTTHHSTTHHSTTHHSTTHHSTIHPMRISHNDPTNTSNHNMTPCNSGRCPTCLMVPTEMPLPIKNRVAVNPIFATFTAMP